jgi:GNAT superfamily N-acetyltransferase
VRDLRVESFVPREVDAAELFAWCKVFSEGQRELAGNALAPAVLANRMLAADAAGAYWAVRLGNAPICGVAELLPQQHDPRTGFLRLFVAPQTRRVGLGTALLDRVRRGAIAAGMSRVQATVLAGPPGEPFARNWPELKVMLRLERQEQRLDDEAVLRHCRSLAVCPDARYRLVRWRGSAPEPIVPSLGRVLGHVLDAPGAQLQMASRTWGRRAVREWEARMTASGEQLMVSAAVHEGSGDAVAVTVATVPSRDAGLADQHDTAVLPEHRGRGLARWIKAEQTLEILRRFPAVRAVAVTVNRDNQAMVRVNQALGYRRVRERLLVEAPLRA